MREGSASASACAVCCACPIHRRQSAAPSICEMPSDAGVRGPSYSQDPAAITSSKSAITRRMRASMRASAAATALGAGGAWGCVGVAVGEMCMARRVWKSG